MSSATANMDANALYMKLLLIKNIQINTFKNNQIVPKDIAETIKGFLFYDKDVSKHRQLTRAITDTIKNPDIFVNRRCYNSWHYDQQLQIFVSSSLTWIIYVKSPDMTKLCQVDMCATMCDYCGEYMDSETVEKEDIPLCIQCRCVV